MALDGRHVFLVVVLVFFFNDTATTEIYTLSLHDALPISAARRATSPACTAPRIVRRTRRIRSEEHTSELQSPYVISHAVFCLKKKKNGAGGLLSDRIACLRRAASTYAAHVRAV